MPKGKHLKFTGLVPTQLLHFLGFPVKLFFFNQISEIGMSVTRSKMCLLNTWLRLFFTSFCVCGETNAARCLVTNQTAFCTTRPTKKLSLKHSFCAAVFTCFFN